MADLPLYNYAIRVVRVIDGDTIEVDIDLGFHVTIRETVRLYDVDTPEVFGRYADAVRGPKATRFAEYWLRGDDDLSDFLDGLTMDSRKYDPRGKYGRALADIYRAGDPVSLNEALIAAGHEK